MTQERGGWIPWYCEDSPGWLELSLAARGAAEGIARKMGPHRGELHLGPRGLRGLAVLLRCSWAELEPALAELTEGPHPRLVVSEDQRVIIDLYFAARKDRPRVFRQPIPQKLRRFIIERDQGVCHLCQGLVAAAELHLDHVVPWSRGGPNTAENLRVAHARCNMRKGARWTT